MPWPVLGQPKGKTGIMTVFFEVSCLSAADAGAWRFQAIFGGFKRGAR
jgi:hypothetical protein